MNKGILQNGKSTILVAEPDGSSLAVDWLKQMLGTGFETPC